MSKLEITYLSPFFSPFVFFYLPETFFKFWWFCFFVVLFSAVGCIKYCTGVFSFPLLEMLNLTLRVTDHLLDKNNDNNNNSCYMCEIFPSASTYGTS